MKLYLGVTDKGWFEFLRGTQPYEVNFWQPGGSSTFRVLEPGELFLFKLKHPQNAIAGGGFFVKHIILPLSLAWEAFGQNNGTADYLAFREKIIHYKNAATNQGPDPKIGCIILANPFFWEEARWIPQPKSWERSIVQGKSYALDEKEGIQIYQDVQVRLQLDLPTVTESLNRQIRLGVEQSEAYRLGTTKIRLGQGAFKALVISAYNWRCAATGERTAPVLEASHIKPYAQSGPHQVNNGILLRSDVHTLFDLGYLTITSTYQLEVSKRINEEYQNGREYYALHGKQIALPENEAQRPGLEFLNWHTTNVYRP